MTQRNRSLAAPILAALLLVAGTLAGCATAVPPAPTAPAASAPPQATAPAAPAAPTTTTTPTAAAKPPLSVRWVLDSVEYAALTAQTFRLAQQELERLAGVLAPGTWAVALDGDETILSNARHEAELAATGARFTETGWQAWVERREATAIPGAKEFLTRVHELGGAIAVVTNRADVSCPATEDNLVALGLPYDVVLCKPAGSDGQKEPRWRSVEDGTADPALGPLEIVLYLGDSITDFPDLDQTTRDPEDLAPFGSLYFILPNPMYGSWAR